MDSQILTQFRLKELVYYEAPTGFFRLLLGSGLTTGGFVGHPDNKGYLCWHVDGCLHRLHDLAFLYQTGAFPPALERVVHINRDKTDNSWKNLRLVTNAENRRNPGTRKNTRSGHTGVRWDDGCRRWVADITLYGKLKYLGRFTNFYAAVAARQAAELELNFHKSHNPQEKPNV